MTDRVLHQKTVDGQTTSKCRWTQLSWGYFYPRPRTIFTRNCDIIRLRSLLAIHVPIHDPHDAPEECHDKKDSPFDPLRDRQKASRPRQSVSVLTQPPSRGSGSGSRQHRNQTLQLFADRAVVFLLQSIAINNSVEVRGTSHSGSAAGASPGQPPCAVMRGRSTTLLSHGGQGGGSRFDVRMGRISSLQISSRRNPNAPLSRILLGCHDRHQ